jgi:hypothetical protein
VLCHRYCLQASFLSCIHQCSFRFHLKGRCLLYCHHHTRHRKRWCFGLWRHRGYPSYCCNRRGPGHRPGSHRCRIMDSKHPRFHMDRDCRWLFRCHYYCRCRLHRKPCSAPPQSRHRCRPTDWNSKMGLSHKRLFHKHHSSGSTRHLRHTHRGNNLLSVGERLRQRFRKPVLGCYMGSRCHNRTRPAGRRSRDCERHRLHRAESVGIGGRWLPVGCLRRSGM